MARKYPEIADWFALRAAASTSDSSARSARYQTIATLAARDRIPWVEAQARVRFGDTTAAIAAYTRLGARGIIFRLRAGIAHTHDDSASVRRDLVTFLTATPGTDGTRDAIAVFDKLVTSPTNAEQLVLARASMPVALWSRAISGYTAAAKSTVLPSPDRFAYASALARADSDDRAAQQYDLVTSPATLAAAAQYQRARALLATNDIPKARRVLNGVTSNFSRDTSAAAALVLLADLATDARDDAGARKLLLEVARRFPSSRFATPARFNAAMIGYILGDHRTAVVEWRAVAATPTELASQYWLGRALFDSGDPTAAAAAWREVITRDSTSYYAVLASRRLNDRNVHDLLSSSTYPTLPSVDSAAQRMALLRQLRMEAELQFEADRLYRDATADKSRLLATAAVFAGTEQSSRSIALARRAFDATRPTADLYRLLYPVTARDTIIAQARANSIDPTLVAGLIRQESNFNPRAVSSVGARGLMQLMPSVARTIATGKGITPWSADRLFEPGVNITLGVAHLAPLLRRQTDVVRAIAAYNAGDSRVTRWAGKRGADDPEIFVERIPFVETRDYVKSVTRNREMYRALYRWP